MASLWPEDRHLGYRHGHERWRGRVSLGAQARGSELKDMLPEVPVFALTMPLKLPVRGRKRPQAANPSGRKIGLDRTEPPAIQSDEINFPIRKPTLLRSSIRREQSENLLLWLTHPSSIS